jgi:Immunoglobulin I-set domain/PKD domain
MEHRSTRPPTAGGRARAGAILVGLVLLGQVTAAAASAGGTGAAGIRLGAPADLCPPAAPCIVIQPVEETVTAGETAVFEASATGEPAPAVQWQVSTDNGGSWADDLVDPGNNTELLRVEKTSIAENGWKYRVVFHNESGTATSEAARLTVDLVPAVTTNPVDQSVTAGETATFKAAASGKPPPGTQWQLSTDGGASFADDTADAGAKTGTLKVEGASLAENGYRYRALFENSAGTATSAAAALTVSAPAAAPASAPGPTAPASPAASFAWFPASPYIGEPVSLVSSSTDTASAITSLAWDLAGNGQFIAGGQIVTTSFSSVGDHVVRLRVADADGRSSVAAETVRVTSAPALQMQPFPIVRIVGLETQQGVALTHLTVLAPVRARITVNCRGRGCPAKVRSRLAVPLNPRRKAGAVLLAFPRFERFLTAGVVLEVRVSKPGTIGKYTRFVVRRGRLPARIDECLDPGDSKPVACPSS